ncbi:MAG: hypothetical protein PUG10_03750 [Lachnospiraceae bacterium]|nr:hypothetical protein [Lachnospiraceae bacterium]
MKGIMDMEKERTEQIIDKLIDMIENGQSMPLATGKVVVNKDEAISLLAELDNIVKGEQKIYREVNDRRGKIITDAKKEAEEIIYEAEQTASRIRVTKRMTSKGSRVSINALNEDEKEALRTAGDIYAASLIYTDEMLTEVNDVVAQAYELINNQYGRMIQTLEEKAKIIADNKAELMMSLKELSNEERYAQIMDLGSLLSYELYNERAKAKEMEKSGSYQMEIEFDQDENSFARRVYSDEESKVVTSNENVFEENFAGDFEEDFSDMSNGVEPEQLQNNPQDSAFNDITEI